MDYWLIAQAIFVALIFAGLVIYVIVGKHRQRKNPNTYKWKPEQDYDVVLRGETPMSPGFPTLKKREKPGSSKPENSQH